MNLRLAPALGLVMLLAALPAYAQGLTGAGRDLPESAPRRVVSINLCTDQLAMLLAAPGQLVSVSHLAADPMSSAMAREAEGLPVNRGGAEEIHQLAPDLVLAGDFARPETFAMLDRLGIKVLKLPVARGLQDVPTQIAQIAAALGREAAGAQLIEAFETRLAALEARRPAVALEAAIWHPNGYTAGQGTLSDDVLARAGFMNIAAREGLAGGGFMALERLVMAHPQVVITARPWPGASIAEEVMRHPALAALQLAGGEGGADMLTTTDSDWVCGTPHVLDALERLLSAREAMDRDETTGAAP